MRLKQMSVLAILLCCLAAGAPAAQPAAGEPTAREQRALRKAQKKKIREEVRYYESLRNEAVVKFAGEHRPESVFMPTFIDDFRVRNIVCVGDYTTGSVVLHLELTPLYGGFRIYMGGERNGTQAIADGERYPSTDTYGRVYTFRAGQSEQINVMFARIPIGTPRLDRIDISMGRSLNVLNLITLQNVPVFWTYSDTVIRNYVRAEAQDTTANKNQ